MYPTKGGKTAGIDKVVWKGAEEYWEGIQKLDEIVRSPEEYKASPLRRVMIPKNLTEKRPLGIPTMLDHQFRPCTTRP